MLKRNSAQYFRGRISLYDSQRHRGVIWPDEGQEIFGQLVLRNKSLRDPNIDLVVNDRVLFSIESIDRGLLAVDVHKEKIQDCDSVDSSERLEGTIKVFNQNKGYGFVTLIDRRDAFFHVTYLSDPGIAPVPGSGVTCRIVKTAKGIQAQDIVIDTALSNITEPSVDSADPTSQNWLAQAIIARDNNRNDEAARLYDKGLQYSPSVSLVLSYASMERARRNFAEAAKIYEKGIAMFGEDARIREDAGLLAAAQREYPKALRLLSDSLEISRTKNQGRGERGILLGLARTYYRMDEFNTLPEAIKYYEDAQQMLEETGSRLDDSDSLALNLARIRIHHHRGNLSVQFLRSARLTIVRGTLKPNGAEFVVEVNEPEFRESYGVAQRILVRCMFDATVTRADLEQIDESVREHDMVDEQVALIIVASLSEDLQRDLFVRIEQKKFALAIVPIQQSQIETLGEPRVVLREILDRWLYRRDLFAGNVPVVGRRFFGRDKALAEIRDAIASSTPTAIYGLRKVGKTSLLQESQRRAAEAGDIVVYVDLLSMPAEISDCRWLYYEIDKRLSVEAHRLQIPNLKWRLSGAFEEYLDIPADFPVATAFDSDLKRLLQFFRRENLNPKPKVVLLLDEIERLLPTSLGKRDFTGSLDFFSYIRGVSQETADFVVIITGANSLITEAPQFDGRDNPVFNFFNDTYLQFLEEDETDVMLKVLGRGMGIRFEVAAVSYIQSLTGGHPFFTKQLCSFIASHNPDRPLKVTRAMSAELANQYLAVKSSDFYEIIARLERDFPEELKLCIDLARAGGSVAVARLYGRRFREDHGSTLRHLVGYQIVRIANQRAFLTIDLLRRWLQKRYGYDV